VIARDIKKEGSLWSSFLTDTTIPKIIIFGIVITPEHPRAAV